MVQPVPLHRKQRLHIFLRPSESGNARQGRDLFRLMPGLEAQEHIRPHQKPELIVRIQCLQLHQCIGGIAFPSAPQLYVQRFHLAAKAQLFPRQAGHFQPLLRSGAALRQCLMGRDAGGNQQQLVQLQRGNHRRSRRQVSPMRRIECPAVNTDFQENSISCVFSRFFRLSEAV